MPSEVGVTSAHMASRFSVTVSMRLDSLTFNSAASFIVVVPSAKAAMTAMTGSSSISDGMISPSIVVPCKLEDRTRRSQTGSPETVRQFCFSMSAPMADATRRMPSLVGFMPTFLMSISEFGTISPAAIKYAAEEMSPGTSIF